MITIPSPPTYPIPETHPPKAYLARKDIKTHHFALNFLPSSSPSLSRLPTTKPPPRKAHKEIPIPRGLLQLTYLPTYLIELPSGYDKLSATSFIHSFIPQRSIRGVERKKPIITAPSHLIDNYERKKKERKRKS